MATHIGQRRHHLCPLNGNLPAKFTPRPFAGLCERHTQHQFAASVQHTLALHLDAAGAQFGKYHGSFTVAATLRPHHTASRAAVFVTPLA